MELPSVLQSEESCEEECITDSICIQPKAFNSIRTELSLIFSHFDGQ